MVPGCDRRPADFHIGTCVRAICPDRALQRRSRPADQRADALVLRDADHLSLLHDERQSLFAAVSSEPILSPGRVVPGDSVFWSVWTRAIAPAPRRLVGRGVPLRLLAL